MVQSGVRKQVVLDSYLKCQKQAGPRWGVWAGWPWILWAGCHRRAWEGGRLSGYTRLAKRGVVDASKLEPDSLPFEAYETGLHKLRLPGDYVGSLDCDLIRITSGGRTRHSLCGKP